MDTSTCTLRRYRRARRQRPGHPLIGNGCTLGDAKVASLADSISRVGLLNPIVVRADKSLVAGRHRLAAATSLGWTDIECNVCNGDDLHAELAECDENLIRADLTVLDQAEHLAWRDDILRRMGARMPAHRPIDKGETVSPFLPGAERHEPAKRGNG